MRHGPPPSRDEPLRLPPGILRQPPERSEMSMSYRMIMSYREYLALRYRRTAIPSDMMFMARELQEAAGGNPCRTQIHTPFVLQKALYILQFPADEVLGELAEHKEATMPGLEALRLAMTLWQSALTKPDRIEIRERIGNRRDPLTTRELLRTAPVLLRAIGDQIINMPLPTETEPG